MKKINYNESFAFTLKFELLKLLFILIAYFELMVYSLNVNNAYLNNNLFEEIYIIISLEHFDVINNKIFRLLKELYNFK